MIQKYTARFNYRQWREKLAGFIAGAPITSAARAVQADVLPHQNTFGIGQDWAPIEYGEYYATSVPVYSAIKIRADALGQVPWVIHRPIRPTAANKGNQSAPVEKLHPAQAIFDAPNPDFSGAELRKATETSLNLWGRAFWAIEPSEDLSRMELWNLRADRMVVIPGRGRRGPYIAGYVYRGATGDIPYLPEEIEFFRLHNPLQDRTGMSPIAPLRTSADMGRDAMRYNRNTFINGAIPDYILLGDADMTDEQAQAFYTRWEARFQGVSKAGRPAIASSIRDVKTLAFSARELEFNETIKLTIKDASRVFGVPEVLLSELEFATLANMEALVRLFWQSTMLAEAKMFEERITTSLLPKLGFPGLELHMDFSNIDALNEGRGERVEREKDFLDRGAVTINEVREGYGQAPVPWGNQPHFREQAPNPPGQPGQDQRRPTNTNGASERAPNDQATLDGRIRTLQT